ncbi:E3 ubiquitin/ISG15 ligase TRIM25-like [Aplochiton taeniatus]
MESISCSICLDILKDPVTTACGHSYCMVCIEGCWDQDDPKGVYLCPQCRHIFSPRPVLSKNTLLAELVQKIEKTGHQAWSYVECDACTGTKPKAVKSCLVCMASYCETHLQLHNELNPGNRHKVIDATEKLQEKICPHHDKLMEVYCRTDQQCICYLCTMDDHKAHDIVSIASERKDKQAQLQDHKTQCHQRIQQRERKMQELRTNVDSLKRSAQAAVEDSELIFTELIRLLERRRTEVKELIRAREKAEVNRVEALLKRLEQEVSELRRADSELEQLSLTEHDLHFLQMFQPQPLPPGSGTLSAIHINPLLSFKDLRTFTSKLRKKLQDTCTEEMGHV